MITKVYKKLVELIELGEPAAVVTVVETKGSAPARPGFKMLVDARGRNAGTVGGGVLEAEAVQEALKAMDNNSCKLYQRQLTPQEAESSGMICGGEVTLF
ncbi:MAG TPA: XdhC family protein, partial [Firmicutes bacterium]|nr:XdhC family protein [Bacillota bacterium]